MRDAELAKLEAQTLDPNLEVAVDAYARLIQLGRKRCSIVGLVFLAAMSLTIALTW